MGATERERARKRSTHVRGSVRSGKPHRRCTHTICNVHVCERSINDAHGGHCAQSDKINIKCARNKMQDAHLKVLLCRSTLTKNTPSIYVLLSRIIRLV